MFLEKEQKNKFLNNWNKPNDFRIYLKGPPFINRGACYEPLLTIRVNIVYDMYKATDPVAFLWPSTKNRRNELWSTTESFQVVSGILFGQAFMDCLHSPMNQF